MKGAGKSVRGHKYLKTRRRFAFILWATFTAQLISPGIGYAHPLFQTFTPRARAEDLLARLSPEEKVGQLFIIEFQGSEVSENNPIYDLIREGHIGGVILKRSNDNFTDTSNILEATWNLNQNLQQTDWDFTKENYTNPITGESYRPQFIPLFIGIEQVGNGYPDDQILSGMTRLPSQMAIGATWNTQNAFNTGQVLGLELHQLGFNLYLGPSLDILETPRPDSKGDLGINSFGGSPYWVGLMAESYIAGLHTGSENKLLVIGKHFPGYGGAERPREEDIPAVRRSLEQLEDFDLAPYFRVMGTATSNETTLDGVLLAHAKYQGFQGDITPSTRPISFDPQAFAELFSQPNFLSWQEAGGLVISDQLGTQAVRRFYDPTQQQFNAPLVALNAFHTGNDLLYLGKYTSPNDANSTTTINETLQFFTQKYREDQVFAQRVDNAVLRILTTKFSLYERFTLTNVIPPIEDLSLIGQGSNVSFTIASQSATLISPSKENLNSSLPNPPGINDRIVIITDTFEINQCSTCENQYLIPFDGFKQVATRLYGSEGVGQIRRQNLSSFTFQDLTSALDGPEENFAQLIDNIQRANWIIFILGDVNDGRPTSDTLQRFLAERPDLIQGKNTVVFAVDAPYYLDATDISKLSAYYALYSKQPQFIEIATRLLFKEITANGSSPVSIAGIEYDLNQKLSPDTSQVFDLDVSLTSSEINDNENEENENTPEPTADAPLVEFQTGDSITIETSPILDFNKHPVPNGTAVRFVLRTTTTDGTINQREVIGNTINGVVTVNTILETAGILEIQAESGSPPLLSAILQFDVSNPEAGAIASPQTTQDPGSQATPSGEDGDESGLRPDRTTLQDWVLVLLTTVFLSLVSYQIGANTGKVRWGLRWGLTTLIGGMIVNAYLSFNFPGSQELLLTYKVWGIVILTSIGSVFGFLVGWIWYQRQGQ